MKTKRKKEEDDFYGARVGESTRVVDHPPVRVIQYAPSFASVRKNFRHKTR